MEIQYETHGSGLEDRVCRGSSEGSGHDQNKCREENVYSDFSTSSLPTNVPYTRLELRTDAVDVAT